VREQRRVSFGASDRVTDYHLGHGQSNESLQDTVCGLRIARIGAE
jgi:hypothetical protein